MKYTDSDERKSLVARAPYSYSRRYIMFTTREVSERFMFVHYHRSYITTRHLLCVTGLSKSERKCFVPASHIKYSTSRACTHGGGYPATADRWCTYCPGAKVVTATAHVRLCLRYVDKRTSLCCVDPMSMRRVMFSYVAPSERYSWAQIVGTSLLSTPPVNSTIIHHNDRTCYVETSAWSSMRFVMFPITLSDARICRVEKVQFITLHTPMVDIGVGGIKTERVCAVCHMNTFSERTCLIVQNYYSERTIMSKFRIFSDRAIMVAISRVFLVDNLEIRYARLVFNERYATCKASSLYTDRMIFLETRALQTEIRARNLPYDVALFASTDEHPQYDIASARELSLQHTSIVRVEQQGNTTLSKLKIRSATNNTQMSAVDNRGAALTGTDKKLTKLFTLSATLDIILEE